MQRSIFPSVYALLNFDLSEFKFKMILAANVKLAKAFIKIDKSFKLLQNTIRNNNPHLVRGLVNHMDIF